MGGGGEGGSPLGRGLSRVGGPTESKDRQPGWVDQLSESKDGQPGVGEVSG